MPETSANEAPASMLTVEEKFVIDFTSYRNKQEKPVKRQKKKKKAEAFLLILTLQLTNGALLAIRRY